MKTRLFLWPQKQGIINKRLLPYDLKCPLESQGFDILCSDSPLLLRGQHRREK